MIPHNTQRTVLWILLVSLACLHLQQRSGSAEGTVKNTLQRKEPTAATCLGVKGFPSFKAAGTRDKTLLSVLWSYTYIVLLICTEGKAQQRPRTARHSTAPPGRARHRTALHWAPLRCCAEPIRVRIFVNICTYVHFPGWYCSTFVDHTGLVDRIDFYNKWITGIVDRKNNVTAGPPG